MRRRYQEGSLKKVDGRWIAQWWEDGHRRKRTLELVSMVPKAQARSELDAILGPINSRADAPPPSKKWGDFVKDVYLPFYPRGGDSGRGRIRRRPGARAGVSGWREGATANRHRIRRCGGPGGGRTRFPGNARNGIAAA